MESPGSKTLSPKNRTLDRLHQQLPLYRAQAEAALDGLLPPEKTPPARLHEAMRYSVLGGGKRLRPCLVYAAGEALGLVREQLDGPACAVELIHAYSLVHDDLPAMDDDDLRRGKPTCHKAYDDATAILVGDALQALAFRCLVTGPAGDADAARRLSMIEHLSVAAGSRGMVGGQAMDLEAEGRRLDLAELENLHIHKTGALIRVSVLLGALCSCDEGDQRVQALDHYAKCIGLAFQIQDDVLDVEGNTDELGKTSGADEKRDKATYPALLGLREAKQHAGVLIDDALDTLSGLGPGADTLRGIARYIVERRN